MKYNHRQGLELVARAKQELGPLAEHLQIVLGLQSGVVCAIECRLAPQHADFPQRFADVRAEVKRVFEPVCESAGIHFRLVERRTGGPAE